MKTNRNPNILCSLLITIFFIGYAYNNGHAHKHTKGDNEENAIVRAFLSDIFKYNKEFASSDSSKDKKGYLKKQTPTVTLVTCSDSRIATESFNSTTDINNFFVIRNIGNQMDTAQGSVEYGVRVLGTKILAFIGHTECGAIDASLKDMSRYPRNLWKELDSLSPYDNSSLDVNIIANIDNQVEKARSLFKDLVDTRKLLIIGILYDLHNKLGGGNHRLYISNVNGKRDDKIIAAEPWMKDMSYIKILPNSYHALN